MSLIKKIKFPNETIYDIGSKWSNIDKESVVYEPSEIVSFENNKIEPLKKCIINIKAVQEGSGDPSPENVRPIIGFDSAMVFRAGKNLFDKNAATNQYIDSDGLISEASNARLSGYIPINSVCTCSVQRIGTGTDNVLRVAVYDANRNFLYRTLSNSATEGDYNTVTINDQSAKYVRVGIFTGSQDINTMQVEFGASRTSYESFIGPSYFFDWSDKAGIVYGGTLDALTGVLTVDRKGYVFDGTENWGQFWDAPQRIFRLIRNGQVKTLTGRASSHFANAQVTSGTTDIGYYAYNGTASSIYIQFRPNLDDIPDLDSWKAWLAAQAQAGTPLICYHTIATPQVYHFTPTEISTLLGENNIWTDCGNISIELENFYSDIQTEITTNLNENTLLYKSNNSLISSNILIENDDLYFSKLDTYSPPRIFVSLNSDNKTYRNMDIGWTYSLGNGAVLGLREEHFPGTPGAFFLCARRTLIENENTSILTTQFRGTPEGSITISNDDNTVCLNINTSTSSTINPKDYNLYVNGTTYLKGDTKISANTSTVGCILQYNDNLDTLNFVFD